MIKKMYQFSKLLSGLFGCSINFFMTLLKNTHTSLDVMHPDDFALVYMYK